MIRHIALKAFASIPIGLLEKLANSNAVVIYYHMISDDEVPHIKHLYVHKNTNQFKRDLDYLASTYDVVNLMDMLRNQGVWKQKQRPLLLTFDDGFKEMRDIVAPILKERGIPATFFISSAFLDNGELCYQHKASLLIEKVQKGISSLAEKAARNVLVEQGLSFPDLSQGFRSVDYRRKHNMDRIAEILSVDFQQYLKEKRPYLSTVQVRELMKMGFTIGAHSIDHPYYSCLTLKEQLFQTIKSVEYIRNTFDLHYGAFAFPHNDANVSRDYFKKIDETGLVDVSFGTGGIAGEKQFRHIQRVSLEDPACSARELLAWQYVRKLYRQIRGETMVYEVDDYTTRQHQSPQKQSKS